MDFPIPNGKAKQAARDLARDVRELGKEALRLHEAIQGGEASPSDIVKYNDTMAQIKSMCEVRFHCEETGRVYNVQDYVTTRREFEAIKRESEFNARISFFPSALRH